MFRGNAKPIRSVAAGRDLYSVSFGIAALLGMLSLGSIAKAQTATINWSDQHQTIDGFGAADAFESLTSAQADQFFSPTLGLGFSLMRTQLPDDGSCTSVSLACAGQVADMKLAVARGARVWSTPWSPPASMKSNGTTICNSGSGNGSLMSGSYGAYATYLSNYIASVTNQGVTLYALSIQNEPDYCPTSYDGAAWTGANFHDFITNNLGPKLASAGQTSVRIIMPEAANWNGSGGSGLAGESDACMADAGCYDFIGINAWHDYDATWSSPNAVPNPYTSLDKGYWETEASGISGLSNLSLCDGCWDPSMADGLLWASIIDNRMAVANANAWHFWWLINRNGDNEGLINQDGVTTSKRMYVLGQYSKFVRPGWVRIDATHAPTGGVTVSAYKDPNSGNFAIVVTNQNSSNTNVTFSLSGFTPASVTPWVTLGQLEPGGNRATSALAAADLPVALAAQSVTTFVGTWRGARAPAAPTITGVVVHQTHVPAALNGSH